MNCPNCNTEIHGADNFCPKCGARLSPGQAPRQETPGSASFPDGIMQPSMPQPPTDPPKKKKKGLLVAGLSLLSLLVIAGIIGGIACYRHMTQVKELQAQLADLTEDSLDLEEWISTEKKDFQRFVLEEEEEEELKDYWKALERLDPEDYESQIHRVQQIKDFKEELTAKASAQADAQLKELKDQDPGYASDSQKAQLAQYAADMEELIAKGQYKDLEPLSREWKSFAEAAAVKKTGYNVSIMQYDFTEYPKVRLYLDIKDASTGNSVKELSPNMFYLSERDAGTGSFLTRTIEKAVLLNENERLNINLLADTSGSMEGSDMSAAKNIMINFLNTLQFSAGDQVKLTPFNSIIDKSGYFTSDISALSSQINGYTADGQTKLYDSIIYGVQDVAGQEGAKCVIAFTDGRDVGSYNSAQDVIDVVSRYHIPVFIVRIGDNSSSSEDQDLMQIAQASGGSFKNLAQFSSDMSDFYSQIYRQLKEYYVLEYTEDNAMGITQDKELSIYIQNGELGGETTGTANAGDELFDSLLGSYLRSYITDMNNHYYNQLKNYVDDTVDPNDQWSIQWQMQKQVSGGFSNVTAETLMDYSVASIVVEDENTIRLKANERYDVIYDETYGQLTARSSAMARDVMAILTPQYGYSTFGNSSKIRVWAMVSQSPEYILKKGADGKWKFSKYAGDLALGETRHVYDAEITRLEFGEQ